MAKLKQPSFARGEIAPELHGRTDTSAYRSSLALARNTIVHQYGGISNRPGKHFIAPIKDRTKKARLIPFVFGSTDTHLLEFGDQYIRFFRNDAPITDSNSTITGATNANPIRVTTSAAHGLTNGEEVILSDVGGMLEVNGRRFTVQNSTATQFDLWDPITGATVDGTGFGVYTSGGNSDRVYEISSPYLEAQLHELKYTQSFDVLTLTHPSHNPKELIRSALASWALTDVSFTPDQQPPTGIAVTVTGTPSTYTTRYAVTAISDATGEESLTALSSAVSFTITGVTQANPAVVTFSAAPAIETGHEIEINSISGMTELNGRRFRVTEVTTTTFQLQGVDSTNYTAYSSGGTANPAFGVVTNGNNLTALDNTVTWSPVAGASRYSIYREHNGTFGFVGESAGTTFKDDQEVPAPDLSDNPPFAKNPFLEDGDKPGAVGQHQSRKVYGGSNNRPFTVDYSQIGAFNNFGSAPILKSSDAFSTTLIAQKSSRIRHILSFNDLLLFTNSNIWSVTSGDSGFAFDTIQNKSRTEMGSSQVPPLVISQRVVFEEENGERIHAARFDFASNGYATEDLTLFAPHLLRGERVSEWAFAPWPEPILYTVTDVGHCLALTYNPEEQAQVTGWCHWDTEGDYESVASIRPSITDRQTLPYFIVKRTVNGQTVRYIERLDDRDFSDEFDAFFVDSGSTYEDAATITNVTSANPVVVTAAGHGFSDGDIVDISGIVWTPTVDEHFNKNYPAHLNGIRYSVDNSTANTFELREVSGDLNLVDGSAFAAYLSGGKARKAVTKMYGFHHLAGEEVVALADGNVIRGLTVASDGTLTFTREVGIANVGLGYVSDIQTLPPTSETMELTGAFKNPNQINVHFLRSRGLLIGNDSTSLTEWKQTEFELIGQPTQLLTGIAEITINSDWTKDGQLFLREKDPLPLTILSITPDYSIG